MKKMIGVLLTFVLLMNAVIVAPVSASDDGIMPYANNYFSAKCEFSCSTSGYATVKAELKSNSYTTEGTIYTYIQVLEGGKWETINNGQPNNKWADSFDENGATVTHHMYLPYKGSYRAVAVFYVRGTAGIADTAVRNSNICTY